MLVDRFLGSLVGLAVGDALGGPADGFEAAVIRERYGRIEGYCPPQPDEPRSWRQPGLHSDDTQQALAVTEAILETGWADPDAIVSKLIALSEGPHTVPFGAHRGTGRNFRFSVQDMRRHGRWDSGARNTAGIGASMRVAPVGLFFAGDDPAIRTNACSSALVTHTDPRACLAACAVAYLAAHVSRSATPIDAREAHAATLQFVRRCEGWFMDTHGRRSHASVRETYGQFGDALEALGDQFQRPPDVVLPAIARTASELAGQDVGHPCRGFALAGVVAAIYFFLHYGERYHDALIAAVNAGGDADSVGAIVGALCGAAAGESAIPEPWLAGLVGLQQIRLRALALAGEEPEGSDWQPLETFELDLTLAEDRLRRAEYPPGTFPDTYEWEQPAPRQPADREEVAEESGAGDLDPHDLGPEDHDADDRGSRGRGPRSRGGRDLRHRRRRRQ
jgi:ADP-ribosyl-[dinitrogen reductase] hydrolase